MLPFVQIKADHRPRDFLYFPPFLEQLRKWTACGGETLPKTLADGAGMRRLCLRENIRSGDWVELSPRVTALSFMRPRRGSRLGSMFSVGEFARRDVATNYTGSQALDIALR